MCFGSTPFFNSLTSAKSRAKKNSCLVNQDYTIAMITKDIYVEELVEKQPEAVKFLRDRGIVCVLCGEPVWGTLEELTKSKGFTDEQIEEIVAQLNQLNEN